MRVLITGCSGFIGYNLSKKLLIDKSLKIIGIDNLNDYYDKKIKLKRNKDLIKNINFIFKKLDISNYLKLKKIFDQNKIDYVVHLAAQAGVRYSISNPDAYFNSNIKGFYNILKLSSEYKIRHFVFASSSSVYGHNNRTPFYENNFTDSPLSFYAASKKIDEIMSYSYSNIHKLPATSLRFFTVYGPNGRPDMAIYKFTESIIKNKPIKLFNNGKHSRDFTYIDDAVKAVIKIIKLPPKSKIPFDCVNIGSGKKISIKQIIKIIEKKLQTKAIIKYDQLQRGDVQVTQSSNYKLKKNYKISIKTPVKQGIEKFIEWYLSKK